MNEVIIMKVKLMLEEFDKCDKKTITYDWDAGHSYSIIKSDIYSKMIKLCEDNELPHLEDEVTDHCNEWLYENDECPPCEIHVSKMGEVSSGCGCHDHLDPIQESEEIQDILIELSELEKTYNNPYLITVE